MKVNTDELNRQAMELRRIAARINDIEDSVQRVSRVLSRERFGERFRSPLNSMARTITGRAEELNRMSSALQQISALYEGAETRIIDEAEHANVHYEHDLFGFITIPSILDRVLWNTQPVYPRPIPVRPNLAEDVLVVDGLPTLDDIGWEEAVESVFDTPDEGPHCNVIPIPGSEITDQMRDALRDAVIRQPGTGYIPPVEIPVPTPIDVSEVFASRSAGLRDLIGTGHIMDHADTILGTSGLIDWTPWEA